MKGQPKRVVISSGSCRSTIGDPEEGTCCWRSIGSGEFVLDTNNCAEGFCPDPPGDRNILKGMYIKTRCRPVTSGSTECRDREDCATEHE